MPVRLGVVVGLDEARGTMPSVAGGGGEARRLAGIPAMLETAARQAWPRDTDGNRGVCDGKSCVGEPSQQASSGGMQLAL